jgi:FixJ family two-component response regulator
MTPARSTEGSSLSPARISVRERQVLGRIAAGMTSKEIATDLGIMLRTVHTHRENLAKKLGTSSVAAMTRYALQHGIDAD